MLSFLMAGAIGELGNRIYELQKYKISIKYRLTNFKRVAYNVTTTEHSNEGVVARERDNVNIMTDTVWLVLNNETHVLQ